MSPCLAIALLFLAQQPIGQEEVAKKAMEQFMRKDFRPIGLRPPGLPDPLAAVAPVVSLPPTAPTSPTLITLDFKNQAVSMIAYTLRQRTGGQIELLGTGDSGGTEKRISLETPKPVPFWEMADRFSSVAGLQRSVVERGNRDHPTPHIQFHGPAGSDYGPALYVGPFRFGAVTIHEHFSKVFTPARPPLNSVGKVTTDFNKLATLAAPTFFAEVPVLAELNLMATTTGPLRKLEAIDDLGQSLLDPKLSGEGLPFTAFENDYQFPKSIRIPLVRPTKPSQRIAVLRGVVPVEVGRKPSAQTSTIALEGSTGKTFRDGDLVITVREYKTNPNGQVTVNLTLGLEGERGNPKLKGLVGARLWSTYYGQVEFVDVRGNRVEMQGGNASAQNERMNPYYSFYPNMGGMPPTHLRIYRPQWVNWDLPFEFKDLILP